jgi:uncharacterized protein YlxP (DUF503 family)
MAYIVGILQVELHIPLCGSLKEKRGILRSLENAIRKKFNVSVSEIGRQDAWQSAELGVAAGSASRDLVDQTLHRVIGLIEQNAHVQVEHFEVEIL